MRHSIPLRIIMAPGDLMIMRGQTQLYYKHCIKQVQDNPKEVPPRISLTFRRLYSPSEIKSGYFPTGLTQRSEVKPEDILEAPIM